MSFLDCEITSVEEFIRDFKNIERVSNLLQDGDLVDFIKTTEYYNFTVKSLNDYLSKASESDRKRIEIEFGPVEELIRFIEERFLDI